MKRYIAVVILGALIFAAPVAAKVITVQNPMVTDLDAAGNDILNAHDIRAAGGAVIEMNAQGELSMYSALGAPSAYLAAEGGSGALVQVHGQGSGTPGDVFIQPEGGLLRLGNLPTSDPGVSDAIWNDNGVLRVSP